MRKGWTLEKQNWNDLLTVLTGTNWARTKLDILYKNRIPERPGVYVICLNLGTMNFTQRPFKDIYEIIYVGRSESSVQSRFVSHCNKPLRGVREAKDCFGNNLEFWYTEVDYNKIREIEARIIQCFGPPANLKEESIPARTTEPHPA